MNTAEVDLDRLVDYEREYRSVVKRAQVTGDHMIGLCPFHDDSKNSFSVDLKTGVVPHEGTWIEISTQRDSWRLKGSFPTWERELK